MNLLHAWFFLQHPRKPGEWLLYKNTDAIHWLHLLGQERKGEMKLLPDFVVMSEDEIEFESFKAKPHYTSSRSLSTFLITNC